MLNLGLIHFCARPKIKSTNTTKKNFNNKFRVDINHQCGFNLIEVSITLSILSILVSTATPYFSDIIATSKIRTASHALQTSLRLARQYALTSNSKVHICPISPTNQQQCSDDRSFNANWSLGWLVFSDLNDNNDLDDNDSIIHINAVNNNLNIVFNQQGRLRFFNDGSARSAGFYLCSNTSDETRHIRLLYTGRSRTTEITNQNQQSICLSASS